MRIRVALARARARLGKVQIFLERDRFGEDLLKLMRVIRKKVAAMIVKVR
jgi:hypothetical protein